MYEKIVHNEGSVMFDGDTNWPYWIEVILSIISIIGGFFIILMFLLYKHLRSFALELVVYLTISTIFNNTSYLIHYISDENIIEQHIGLCKTQAFIMIWFESSQVTWAALIGYSVYSNVVHLDINQGKTTPQKRFKYIITGFLLPSIFAIIGLICDFFGPSGRWCWVNFVDHRLTSKIYGGIVYSFIWIMIAVNLFLTVIVIRYLNRVFNNEEEKDYVKKFIYKLIRYPIIQIICIAPATINRLLFYITDEYYLPVQIIAIIFNSSQGFLYALAYGYNPQVKNALMDSLSKVFPCCFPNRHELSFAENHQTSFLRNSTDSFKSTGSDKHLMVNT